MTKTITLQAQKKKYSLHYKFTMPSSIVNLFGWEKGDKFKATPVLGSGQVIIEKIEGDKQ